jgi:glucose/arabinose dehydrogenase
MAKIVKVGTFSAPVQVVQPPGQTTRLWVVRKRGQISVMSSGKVLPAAALDIGGQVSFGAEQGLLGLAFAPDYATSHRAYVTYTDKANQLVLA